MKRTRPLLLVGLLLGSDRAGAAGVNEETAAPAGRLLVKVWDRVPTPEVQWDRARSVVEAAFRTAGLSVVWVRCETGAGAACSSPSAAGEIGLRIFRPLPAERRRAGESTGGAAFTTDEERGEGIAYVFFNRVEEVRDEGHVPGSLVLGLIAAHEIAHVLLPHGHSASGIMQARFGLKEWKAAEKGWLAFEPGDAARMRRRLDARTSQRASTLALHPGVWTRHIY